MKTISIYENGYTVGFNWSDLELKLIERINQGAGTEILRPTIRAGKRELQARQYVGVVQLGNQVIQVLPKIHRPGITKQAAESESLQNLLYLLSYAKQLPIRETQIAQLLGFSSNWLEILTHLFATHLIEEWQRGAISNYQQKDEDLPVLKGKLRLADQLRHPHRQHILCVQYDEFTSDTPLNRVLRYVVERLWRLTCNSRNRQRLDLLRNWMAPVTLLPRVTADDAQRVQISRLNRRFAPLLTLARLFLESSALEIKFGDATSYAFVFDMNRLFESFILGFITQHRDIVLPPQLKTCDILAQTKGITRFVARRNGKPVFRLKPDLAFYHRATDHFPLLVDAKYKILNVLENSLGVSEADFYQMYTYHRRYDCPSVVMLYPQTVDMMGQGQNHLFCVEGDSSTITVATINLNYDLMHKSVQDKLISELSHILCGAIGAVRRKNE